MSSYGGLEPIPPTRWAPLVNELRQDHIHGASWLARRAADMLAACAKEALTRERGALDDLASLAWASVWARPSMAAIANTVAYIWWNARLLANGSESGETAAVERLRAEALRQSGSWASVVAALEEHIRPLLHDPVFTLSRSGSVEYALTAAARSRPPDAPLEVIIAESRPGGEGIELARALFTAGARVSVVPDSAVGVSMARAGMLLLGADGVRSDGALVNKVGSYPAALVAADRGIPVYALCERLKITPASYPLVLERAPDTDGDSEESWLFDVTPGRLMTALITEAGPLSLAEIAKVAGEREAALATLRGSAEHARERRGKPGHPGRATRPARRPPLHSDNRGTRRQS